MIKIEVILHKPMYSLEIHTSPLFYLASLISIFKHHYIYHLIDYFLWEMMLAVQKAFS